MMEANPVTRPQECTLLDLVQSVINFAESDDEVVATVMYLVNSGRVRLCGTFAGTKIILPPSIHTFLTLDMASVVPLILRSLREV